MRQEFEGAMPEAMAMLKIKGFLSDLGSEVVESLPGLIRVRLSEPGAESAKKKSGLFSLLDRGERNERKSAVLQTASATDLELRMERRNPNQPSLLTFTLIMRPLNGLMTVEWRNRCQKIGIDLRAYLMGR
jgi:hypothetical protein